MKKSRKIFYGLELVLLLAIIVAIPLYLLIFHREFLLQFKSIDDVMTFLSSYKTEGIFIYICIQIVQIIVSVIPGQAFQFAAGYLYGYFAGLFYSIVGATIGTLITYGIAKLLGRDAIIGIFGREKIDKIVNKLNTKKAYTAIFLIYLIPGVPKDLVGYAAGISNVKIKPFLILSTIGRSFGMSGSLLFGVLYVKKMYVLMGVIATVAAISFFICIIFRKKLNLLFDKIYERIT